MSCILFYTIALCFLLFYFKYRSGMLKISDLIMAEVTIFFTASGVYNSYGSSLGYNKLDTTLLFLYLIMATIVPLGLIVGSRIKAAPITYMRPVSQTLLYILVLLVSLYSLIFFLHIRNNIPLFLVFQGIATKEVWLARSLTTDLALDEYKLPFVFRYRDVVFNYISLYLFSILFVEKLLKRNKNNNLLFFLYSILVAFIQLYGIKKAPILYFLFVILLDYYFVSIYLCYNNDNVIYIKQKWNKVKRIVLPITILALFGFVFLYNAFMGFGSLTSGIESILHRVFINQTSFVYLQKIILDENYNGCLYGDGLKIMLYDAIFNRNTINLSKIAYEQIYYSFIGAGGSGTSGSMPSFFVYSNGGILAAIIVLFLVSLLSGYADKKMRLSIFASKNPSIPIAFYSVMAILFFQAFVSDLSKLFQLPFIFSGNVIILFLLTFLLRRITIK